MKRFLLILLFLPEISNAQIITTIAGNDTCGNSGDGGLASVAKITLPTSGVFDINGNYYFTTGSTGNTIRKISKCGIITTVAGSSGLAGFSGDGGPATSAKLHQPTSVAVDVVGNLYISDAENFRVRKVDTSGIITTIAGNGTSAFSGDGGLADTSSLLAPYWVLVDDTGNVYDVEPNRIRKIDTSGIINTMVGTGIAGYGGDGGPASAAKIQPNSAYLDANNDLYIADLYNYRVRKVDHSTGNITTVAGTGSPGYCCDGEAATSANINPFVVTLDTAGNLYIGDEHARVCKVNSSGIISTDVGTGTAGFCCDGGLATVAQIWIAEGLVFDNYSNLIIADEGNCRIRKVTINPVILPTISITSTRDTLCNGTSVTFTASVTGDTTPVYQWLVNGSPTGTDSAYTYTPTNGDSICCVLNVNGLCVMPSSNTIYMVVDTLPNAGAITGPDTTCYPLSGSIIVALFDTTFGGAWSSSNSNFTVSGGVFSGTGVLGSDTIYYIVSNVCGVDSASHIITVVGCPDDVKSITLSNNITLSPNPATTSLTIQSTTQPISNITITNLLGQTLITQTCNKNQLDINIEPLPPAVYSVKVTTTTGQTSISKIIKE